MSSQIEPDTDIARAIAAQHFGAPTDVGLLGQGSNNLVFLAAVPETRVVIKLSKPHREAGALNEYRKEAWCAAETTKLGVSTPPVLDAGLFRDRAFQIQAFIDGQAPIRRSSSFGMDDTRRLRPAHA